MESPATSNEKRTSDAQYGLSKGTNGKDPIGAPRYLVSYQGPMQQSRLLHEP